MSKFQNQNLFLCRAINCQHPVVEDEDFCEECKSLVRPGEEPPMQRTVPESSMAQKYPKYYKSTRGMTEVDVYGVHTLFDIQDPSGCIHHASKKLLLSGVRTGGKSQFDDIREARDTLNRWLELNA